MGHKRILQYDPPSAIAEVALAVDIYADHNASAEGTLLHILDVLQNTDTAWVPLQARIELQAERRRVLVEACKWNMRRPWWRRFFPYTITIERVEP